MTKSTITREESVQAVFDLKVGYRLGFADIEILKRVARIALAAMDGEPVAWWKPGQFRPIYTERKGDAMTDKRYMPLYSAPKPAPERDQARADHAQWSQDTFGNVGPIGPLKHLAKEAMEAAAAPDDLSEWADMQFLLWDAQRRAGITDEQITQAMIDKLAVNKALQWPEPQDGEPRLHIQADNDNTAQQFESLATSTKCKRCDGEGWVADEMGITQCGCGTTTSAGKVKS